MNQPINQPTNTPSFMRFPGGCYVEGDWLANRFDWKAALGRVEERRGHLNGVWGYWSTDGLGLFEYMQLAEALAAEPVWVLSAGVAHADSARGSDVWPYVQDALDSVEFIAGGADTRWGAVRAGMGRRAPWNLTYVAIGNEDCGKPYYLNNYLAIFAGLRARHPGLRLISNCDMGADAPTDMFDWHVYTNPRDLFNRRHAFDGRDPKVVVGPEHFIAGKRRGGCRLPRLVGQLFPVTGEGKTLPCTRRSPPPPKKSDAQAGHYVFASEYAVTDGGGWGNLIGAWLRWGTGPMPSWGRQPGKGLVLDASPLPPKTRALSGVPHKQTLAPLCTPFHTFPPRFVSSDNRHPHLGQGRWRRRHS